MLEGVNSLWYSVRTFVNVTVYPQYYNNMIIKKIKPRWREGRMRFGMVDPLLFVLWSGCWTAAGDRKNKKWMFRYDIHMKISFRLFGYIWIWEGWKYAWNCLCFTLAIHILTHWYPGLEWVSRYFNLGKDTYWLKECHSK
jgi:hypothetical protein